MRRREFVALIGSTLVAPLVRAQQAGRTYRIAILLIGSEQGQKPYVQSFLAGLGERGYALGRNLTAEFRYISSLPELAAFADDLVALKPDVLIASEIPAVFLKQRTATIPIVLLTSADPVHAGLVKSFSRPGTNVTGMANLWLPVAQKQIDLLAEFVRGLSRLALLAAPFDPPRDSPYYGRPEQWEVAVRRAADEKRMALAVHRVADERELRDAMATIRAQRAEGLIVATDTRLLRVPGVLDEVRRSGIASASGFSAFAESGGLLSYGPNLLETHRYAAKFVDLVLKGANPADIPVEQPTRFELVVNLKTAKSLGLTIPQSVLIRADRVIE